MAGAILAVTLSRQLGAVLPEQAATKPVLKTIDGFQFIQTDYPLRFAFEGGTYRKVFPFRDEAGRTMPNPDYRDANTEVQVWMTPYASSARLDIQTIEEVNNFDETNRVLKLVERKRVTKNDLMVGSRNTIPWEPKTFK